MIDYVCLTTAFKTIVPFGGTPGLLIMTGGPNFHVFFLRILFFFFLCRDLSGLDVHGPEIGSVSAPTT